MQRDHITKHDTPFFKKVIRKIIWVTLKPAKKIARVIYGRSFIKSLHQYRRLRTILKNTYGPRGSQGFKIGLIINNGTTHPTSSPFIRLLSPLNILAKEGKLNYRIFKQNTTRLPNNLDICIVQRTAYDSIEIAKGLLKEIKDKHIKLIVDTDDAFKFIDGNPFKKSNEALEFIIKHADQVWVSTKNLAELYKQSNNNIHIVPNSLDPTIWQPDRALKQNKFNKPLELIYMGTATHDDDFNMILKPLEVLHSKYPRKFVLNIIGISAKDLPDRRWINRMYQPKGCSIYPKFVDWFIKQGPFDIGLCPLVESKFNNYKSDIKCLDYFGANIVPFVSEVPAYSSSQLDSIINRVSNTDEEWIRKLEKAIKDPTNFRKNAIKNSNKSYTYLWSKRSVETTAKRIYQLIQQ